jgi:plasmid stabilization system protein ParE
VWLKSAVESLRSLHAWIATENPIAARQVAQAIRTATFRLGDFPSSGRIGMVPGTREIVLANLPYLIVYRIHDQRVEILRVFHTSRNYPSMRATGFPPVV